MIKKIQSKDNKIVKLCKKLQTKKYRDKEDLYVIEGPNLIDEALKSNAKITYILMDEDFKDEEHVMDACGNVYILSHDIFCKIADTKNSQGIIGIVNKTPIKPDELEKKIDSAGNIVVLDNLQDPGNVGTIIRTADAAGYQGVILTEGSCDVFGPKVVRAATGSLFRVPIIYTNYENCKNILKKLNKKIVVTDLAGKNDYYNEDLSSGVALVIGNEGNGVSDEMKKIANVKIKIPMIGKVESLNASVAAAIVMYEAVRK